MYSTAVFKLLCDGNFRTVNVYASSHLSEKITDLVAIIKFKCGHISPCVFVQIRPCYTLRLNGRHSKQDHVIRSSFHPAFERCYLTAMPSPCNEITGRKKKRLYVQYFPYIYHQNGRQIMHWMYIHLQNTCFLEWKTFDSPLPFTSSRIRVNVFICSESNVCIVVDDVAHSKRMNSLFQLYVMNASAPSGTTLPSFVY